MQELKGSCVALVTPMLPSGEIDWQSLEALVNWHCESGTSAIVIAGTTGESPTLSWAEQEALFTFVVNKTNQRIPVIAGTGTHSTQATIDKTAMAKQCGVDAVLVVQPYYNKPPQAGLLAHFKAVAHSTDLPVILYNHPGRTACNIADETLFELSFEPNIIGVKDATADVTHLPAHMNGCANDFIFLSGDDATCVEFVKQGGHGVISVTANILPNEMAQSMQSKNDDALRAMYQAMSLDTNPIPVKAMLNLMHKIGTGIRLPLVWADQRHLRELENIAKEYKLIGAV